MNLIKEDDGSLPIFSKEESDKIIKQYNAMMKQKNVNAFIKIKKIKK